MTLVQQIRKFDVAIGDHFSYKLYRPSQSLRPFVRCYWTLKKHSTNWTHELMQPDGYVDIIFNFGAAYQRQEMHSREHTRVSTSHIVGQRSETVVLSETRQLNLLGVKLRPFGLTALTGIAAHDFLQQVVPLSALPKAWTELEQALFDLPDAAARLRKLEQCLSERLVLFERDPALDNAIRHVLRSHGSVSVSALSESHNLSRRTLERRFLHAVGMSPKKFARVIRFKATLKHLKQQPRALGHHDYLQYGYFDQNHFIKEFKYFMDTTPTAYFQTGYHDRFFSAGMTQRVSDWLS